MRHVVEGGGRGVGVLVLSLIGFVRALRAGSKHM